MDNDNYSSASEEYEYDYSDEDDDYQQQEGMNDDDEDDNLDDDNEASREEGENRMELDGTGSQRQKISNDGKVSASSSWSSSSPQESRGSRRQSDGNPNAAPVGLAEIGGGKDSQSIKMLNSKELLPIMKRKLREVTEVLDIPPSAAAVLMREHKWAKERLFEAFYDDPDKIQKAAGVWARCQGASPKKAGLKSTSGCGRGRKDCGICYEEEGFSAEEMLGMPCGHEFCRYCWRGFVDNALSDGPICVMTTCPEAGCTEVMTEDEVSQAAPDALDKFQSYQLRSFVEMNVMTRWCPGPGCERVAVGTSNAGIFTDTAFVADCDDCGVSFCLKCGEEPHAPIVCKDLAKWSEKCKNESETANWILANTKACPKCSSRIEKNQGCNHMSCQQCKYEFCWICMGNWSEHGANTGGYYRCNKFDPNEDPNGDDTSDAARAKRELDRYLHYYKRYHAHAEAQKFAKRQLRETEARMVLLQESSDNSTWTDVEFLKTANEQLVECRRVLKYTYAFAYYMTSDTGPKSMQKERFEYHQEMLEKFTENLSELSEKPLAEMVRETVVNQTRVVDRFMKNILKYVEDGMEES